MQNAFLQLLRRKLPLTEQDLMEMLDWFAAQSATYRLGIPQIIKVLADYGRDNQFSNDLMAGIRKLSSRGSLSS
jgi:hypothetical protein